MSTIKTVIFDVDGTLIDTPQLILSAFAHVAEKCGLEPRTHDQIMDHMGKSVRDIFLGLYPDEDPDPLVDANYVFTTKNAHQATLFVGLVDTLDALQRQGKKLAVITGGTALVEGQLTHHGIGHYFQSIVHSERVAKQKPDPEGVLLALKECGDISPKDAIVVGDMRFDVLAGKNAGVRATVALTHGFGSLQELKQAGAGYIIDSFNQLLPTIKKIEQK